MTIDRYADAVRDRIRGNYGDTSDLSEEVVNTLCNIYYFAERAAEDRDFPGLLDIQAIHPSKDKASLVPIYMAHMAHVVSAVEFLPDLIESLRKAAAGGSGQQAYLEQLTLDLFKYQIEDAIQKSGLRRSLERKVKTPNEYSGLANRFQVPCRRAGR